MTAEANTLGRRLDGTVRRYGLETTPTQRLIHVLATRTGELAHCGFRPTSIIRPTVERARAIENRTDPSVQGFSYCQDCYRAMTPQPDPDTWGPRRPEQT